MAEEGGLPLVELTTEQAKLLLEQLRAIGFMMNGMERAGRAT